MFYIIFIPKTLGNNQGWYGKVRSAITTHQHFRATLLRGQAQNSVSAIFNL